MNFKFYKKEFSYFTVDNYFTNDEMMTIGPEIESFLPQLTDDVGRADNNRSSKGVFLPTNLKYVKIANKIFKEEMERYTQADIHFRYISNLLFQSRLLNYYEDQDFYDTHSDMAVYTMVVMLCKTPQKFTGGDLVLSDVDTTIEFKNNRAVFFPSFAHHSVTPVSMKFEDTSKGLGRYSITHFFYIPLDERNIPTITNQNYEAAL